MSKRLLDVLEADGGWLTAEGAAMEAGITDQAAKRALHRFRNGGHVETRFENGHNEWRYVEGAVPIKEDTMTRTEKKCSRCQETKPADQFGNNKASPDGLTYYCKPCDKARREEKKAAKKPKAPKVEAPKPAEAPTAPEPPSLNGWRAAFADPTLTQLEQLRALVGVSSLDEAAAISREIAASE